MSFEPRDYLEHILVEADYLIGHGSGLSYATFAADETLRRAFVRGSVAFWQFHSSYALDTPSGAKSVTLTVDPKLTASLEFELVTEPVP